MAKQEAKDKTPKDLARMLGLPLDGKRLRGWLRACEANGTKVWKATPPGQGNRWAMTNAEMRAAAALYVKTHPAHKMPAAPKQRTQRTPKQDAPATQAHAPAEATQDATQDATQAEA